MKPLFALALICLSASCVFAQTEIEGAVSGEWTADDSPYIVIDSTWVPEGERLTLRNGVELQFAENQGLYIYGLFETLGNDGFEDSVRIRVADGVEHWKGLRFYGRNSTQFNYTWIVCPDTAIHLDENYSLTMNHCEVEAERRAISGFWNARNSWSLTFNHSDIEGGMYLSMEGGTVIADHSHFDFSNGDPTNGPGFNGIANRYRFTNCEVEGGLQGAEWGGYSIVEDCIFTKTAEESIVRVGIFGSRGHMQRTFVDGMVGIGSGEGYTLSIEDNTVVGHVTVSNCDAEIKGCDFRGSVRVGSGIISFSNSILGGAFGGHNVDSLSIDSCFVIYDQPAGNGCGFGGETRVFVTHCVLNPWWMSIYDLRVEAYFDHNTFVFNSDTWFGFFGYGSNPLFSNNIFLAVVPVEKLFYALEIPNFEYNCVWGFEYAAGEVDFIPIDEIDSTNIIADPLLEWFGPAPLLAHDSPCIDRGDPEAPLDPDGSRSDIGARAFYQMNYGVLPSEEESHLIINAEVYPNPFNDYLSVSISSPGDSPMMIRLLDLTGRTISEIVHNPSLAGSSIISFDASSLASGSYYIMLRSYRYTRIIPVFCLK